ASKREFEKAQRAYAEAVNLAWEQSGVWVEYANFHHKQNRHQDARRGYLRALRLAREEGNEAEIAVILNNLGVAYNSENRKAEARRAHEEALTIRRKLAQYDPDYLPDLAVTLTNLGVLHRAENRHEEARKAY